MSAHGMTQSGLTLALSAVLPNATNRYIALLTTLPSDNTPTGLVEATGSSYARVAHSSWVDATSGNDRLRKNSGTITFPVLTGALSGVVGWAAFSASSGGTCYAYGPLVNSSDVPITKNFILGDQPRFSDQELHLVCGAA